MTDEQKRERLRLLDPVLYNFVLLLRKTNSTINVRVVKIKQEGK